MISQSVNPQSSLYQPQNSQFQPQQQQYQPPVSAYAQYQGMGASNNPYKTVVPGTNGFIPEYPQPNLYPNANSVHPGQSNLGQAPAVQTNVVTQPSVKGESRIEYIPYERSVTEYEEVRRQVQVPVTSQVTDYYAIQYDTDYIPHTIQEKIIEYVPVERIQERVEYQAVTNQTVIHQPNFEQQPQLNGMPQQPTQPVYAPPFQPQQFQPQPQYYPQQPQPLMQSMQPMQPMYPQAMHPQAMHPQPMAHQPMQNQPMLHSQPYLPRQSQVLPPQQPQYPPMAYSQPPPVQAHPSQPMYPQQPRQNPQPTQPAVPPKNYQRPQEPQKERNFLDRLFD